MTTDGVAMTVECLRERLERKVYGELYISNSHEQSDMDTTMDVHVSALTSFKVHMKNYESNTILQVSYHREMLR